MSLSEARLDFVLVSNFRWIVDRGRAWRDVNGRAVAMAGVNVDITDRKRAEAALRASEERWATTLQSIDDGVISTDAAGNIVFMNEVAQKLTGWSSDEANVRN